ncbi:hypothetical protein BANRA_01946 [Klebsiella quasipneumoniae]|nr:DUF551 domain-containing protein [Klebsiella quasipneumoniae]MBZ7094998.1 DUF551 domain-containing protein [Klebsiella quasipneumoniae]VDA30229.1 hypothetical protein BANRA_01946 [Klebsiella quasipneumoniae]
MTSKLTTERLAEIAQFGFSSAITPENDFEIKELARMALAAMDSEPVAWTWHYREQWHVTNDKCRAEFVAKDGDVAVLPLYRHAQPVLEIESEPVFTLEVARADYKGQKLGNHFGFITLDAARELKEGNYQLYAAQPAPVVQEVDADDNFYSWFGREWRENYQHNQYTTAAKQMLGVMAESAWKAGRRAAMLAAAPQSPGSEPATVPGKWIPVSERMPEDRTQVILWDAEIGEVTSGHYSHKTQTFYHCGDAIENEITHWMLPPSAPQGVKP